MTASVANISHIDVIVAVWAANEKTIVSDIPDFALVIGPAPAVLLASGRAPIPLPVAVGSTSNGFELIQIQYFVVIGTMAFHLLPNAFGVESGAIGKEFFHVIEAIGMD